MISETELDEMLAEAGAAIVEPSVHEAFQRMAAANRRPSRSAVRRRGTLFGGLAVAAMFALVLALVLHPSSTAPRVAYGPLAVKNGVAVHGLSASQSPAPAIDVPARAIQGTPVPTSSSAKSSQKIVATGTLALKVRADELQKVIGELQALAASFDGYVIQSDVALAGTDRGGSVVIGIPATKFMDAISDAEHLGAVRHLSTSARDVTSQVDDLGAQITALAAARTQLEALLARAGSISALLSVENQITSVQSQIQQLQTEQRDLSSQIQYSSLSVSLTLPSTHRVGASSGFSKAWHDAVSGFLDGVRGLVSDLGVIVFALLVALLVALIAVFLGRRVWPLVRRRLL